MKDSDTPQISSTWWRRNKPTTLPSTGLGDALQAYEKAREKAGPTKDVAHFETVIKAYEAALAELSVLEKAVARASAKCNKVVHAACIKVLKKYDPLLDKERDLVERELKSYRDLLTSRVDQVEKDCEKIAAAIRNDAKSVAAKLSQLERLEEDAAENYDVAGHGVAENKPNAALLEWEIAQSYERDAKKLFSDIKGMVAASDSRSEKAWAAAYDRNLLCVDSKRMNAIEDRRANSHAALEVALDRAEGLLAEIAKITKAVHDLEIGAGDVADHFVSICKGLLERSIKNHQMISAWLREVGGKMDTAKFDAMNFAEEQDPAKRNPTLLQNSNNHLKSGLEMLLQAWTKLEAAQQNLVQGRKAFPAFVKASDVRFKDVLEQLDLVAESLADDAKEAAKLRVAAKKARETLKASFDLAKKILA